MIFLQYTPTGPQMVSIQLPISVGQTMQVYGIFGVICSKIRSSALLMAWQKK